MRNNARLAVGTEVWAVRDRTWCAAGGDALYRGTVEAYTEPVYTEVFPSQCSLGAPPTPGTGVQVCVQPLMVRIGPDYTIRADRAFLTLDEAVRLLRQEAIQEGYVKGENEARQRLIDRINGGDDYYD